MTADPIDPVNLDASTVQSALLELAVAAGEAILRIYDSARHDGVRGASARLDDKSDHSPLTRADLAANDILCQGLRRLTPDIAVVSEEDNSSTRQEDPGTFWLIDPLDGTKEFLAFNGDFTVNIALIVGGKPYFGVVYAPVLHAMYWGGLRFGAFRQTNALIEPIRVASPRPSGSVQRIIASRSHLNQQTSSLISRFPKVEIVQAGSSLKFCRVAEGAADIYPRLGPTCEWDTAAGQAVLEGAGGFVFDAAGFPLSYGKADVLNPHFIAASARRVGGELLNALMK